MFNLTSFWVRDNCISLFEDRNLENYELFVELSTTSSMTDAFCLAGTALVLLHRIISVNVPPDHQRDRKKSENGISVCKTFAFININDRFQYNNYY